MAFGRHGLKKKKVQHHFHQLPAAARRGSSENKTKLRRCSFSFLYGQVNFLITNNALFEAQVPSRLNYTDITTR
jgi:hypothetical protein